jgi:NitT/TauT family transport system substrate-binding protein
MIIGSRRDVLFGTAAISLIGCSRSGTAPPLRVGFNSWIGYSALYIAEKERFFERNGLTVKLTDSEKLPDRIAALGGGNFDLVGATVDSSVVTAAANVPGKIIFAFDSSNGADGIVVSHDIKVIADLKGKRIAVEEAFTDHFMLLKVLGGHGIGPGDFRLIGLTADYGAVAFSRGVVDAAAIYEPYLTQAHKRRGSKIIYKTSDEAPYIFDVLYAPDRILASQRVVVEKFVSALMRANDAWALAPEKYRSFIAASWNWTPHDVDDAVKEIRIATTQMQREWFLPEVGPIQQAADAAARLWLNSGVIKSSIKGVDLVDSTVIRDVLASRIPGD